MAVSLPVDPPESGEPLAAQEGTGHSFVLILALARAAEPFRKIEAKADPGVDMSVNRLRVGWIQGSKFRP
jgi:hypothetical protein